MERLKQRISSAENALASFHELVVLENPNQVERDASIQRFEFSFEACWKAAKQYLYDIEGVDTASPKGVIRNLRENNILSEEETIKGIQMVNDRNLNVHTYNEEVAIKIHAGLKQYYELLVTMIERMKKRI
ncbi:nucleotidyltransferase substrate binding protein [Aquibacillus koreensis]|uniref:Nucleotidyltransferase substrate binding protein n=1 Tax=Aquibacillus koreensis TaxID=279446 RepID=A0A9X4AIT4_9BACI|nr:nucleotidyltransferase substrate binding protein [Aquibacillus koreensis]MCT2534664.1 nucleotidyltransferase substrate binding protein [Aquibacillus koreensis]MDC3419725.1 nucleotidyltransferase substrate binding protein [Aquibacillus koreensis]